ncbi:MAG: glycosyltransferase family 4 protein [Armatimonadota bacterium]|nr:glycosyltransferase family 4 protein [Armatimonadota bacterium]
MYRLAQFLAERFALDLVAPAGEGQEESARLLKSVCREIEFVPPSRGGLWARAHIGPYEKNRALAQAVHRRLESGLYGAVQVEKPAMLPYLSSGFRVPVILDVWAYGLAGPLRALRHERGAFTRIRNLFRVIRFSLYDAFCWPETCCILVVSEKDRARCARERPGRNVLVVPNGVDCAAVTPGPLRPPGSAVVLFTGDMGFEPNVAAAETLALRIFPHVRLARPDAELRLVGRNPSTRVRRLAGPGIMVTGEVVDMLPHLQAATVYVAPHFTGAGTRTKLLEAMAAGCAIVTTSIGIEGIEAVPGRDVILADDAPSLTAAVVRLLGDPDERARLGTSARRLAETRYDWPRCLAPLESFYRTLLAGESAPC